MPPNDNVIDITFDARESLSDFVQEYITTRNVPEVPPEGYGDRRGPGQALRWDFRSTIDPNNIIYGEMDVMEPTIEVWFLEQALDQEGRQTVGEALAGNHYDSYSGIAAVKRLILEAAAERVDDYVAEREDPIAGFNRVGREWPHEALRELAVYENNERDRDNFPSYQEDIEMFASTASDSYREHSQTTLDWFTGENPFQDSSLTDSEAKMLAVLHLAEDDVDTDFVDEVDDPDAFLAEYYESEDIQTALRSHLYSNSIPREALSELAHPNEWPAGMSPQAPQGTTCINCGDSLVHVVTDDGETTWTRRPHGSFTDANQLGDEYHEFEEPLRRNTQHICEDCLNLWHDRVRIAHGWSENGYTKVRGYGEVFSVENGNHPDEVSSVDLDKLQDLCNGRARGRWQDTYIRIQPNDTFGDVTEQQDEILAIAEEGVDEDGTFYVQEDPHNNWVGIFLPADNPQLVSGVKSRLEEAMEQTPPEVQQ